MIKNRLPGLPFFKKRVLWIAAALGIVFFLTMKNSFLGFAIDCLVSRYFPSTSLTWENVVFKEHGWIMEQMRLKMPQALIEVKTVKLGFKVDLKRLKLTPQITLIDPSIDCSMQREEPALKSGLEGNALIAKDRLWQKILGRIDLNVSGGLLIFKERERLAWSLSSEPDRPEIKKVHLQLMENLSVDSYMTVSLKPHVHDTLIAVELKQFQLNWLRYLPGADQFLFGHAVKDFKGWLSGEISFLADRLFNFHHFNIRIDCDQLDISSPALESLTCRHLSVDMDCGDLPLQPHQEVDLSKWRGVLKIERLNMQIDPHTLLTTEGKIAFNMATGHTVDMNGRIHIDERGADFILKDRTSKTAQPEEFSVEFAFSDEQLKQSTALFSFSSPLAKEWTLCTHARDIPFHYLAHLQKTLGFSLRWLDELDAIDGKLSVDGRVVFDEQGLKQCTLNRVILEEAKLASQGIAIDCNRLEGMLDFDLHQKKIQKWSLCSDRLSVVAKDRLFGGINFREVALNVQEEGERFSPSSFTGTFQDEPFSLEFSGQRSSPELKLKMILKDALFASISGSHPIEGVQQLYQLDASIALQEGLYQIGCSIHHKNATEIQFIGQCSNFNLSELILSKNIMPMIRSIDGNIEGKNIPSHLYMGLIKALKLPWELAGWIHTEGTISQGRLNLGLWYDHLEFFSHDIYLQHRVNKQTALFSKAVLSYDIPIDQLHLTLDLDQAICLHKESQLWFEDVAGHLTVTNAALVIDRLTAKSENLLMQGELELEFYREHPFNLAIQVHDVTGSVSQLQRFARHFPEFQQLNFPLNGKLRAKEKGFELKMLLYPQPTLPEWELNVEILDGVVSEWEPLEFHQIGLDLHLDSNDPCMRIRNLNSSIRASDWTLPYQIASPAIDLEIKNDLKAAFILELKTALLDMISLQGEVHASNKSFHLNLDPNASLETFIPFTKTGGVWQKGLLKTTLKGDVLSTFLKRLIIAAKQEHLLSILPFDHLSELDGLVCSVEVEPDGGINGRVVSFEEDCVDLSFNLNRGNLKGKGAILGSIMAEIELSYDERSIAIHNVSLNTEEDRLVLKDGVLDLVEETGKISVDRLETSHIEKWINTYACQTLLQGHASLSAQLFWDLKEFTLAVDTLKLDQEGVLRDLAWQGGTFCFDRLTRQIKANCNALWQRVGDQQLIDIAIFEGVVDPQRKTLFLPKIRIGLAGTLVDSFLAMPAHLGMEGIYEHLKNLTVDPRRWVWECQAAVNQDQVIGSGKLAEGECWIYGRKLQLKNASIDYDASGFKVQGALHINQEELNFSTQFAAVNTGAITIGISNPLVENETARMVLTVDEGKGALNSLEGNLWGLNFSFLPKSGAFSPLEKIVAVALQGRVGKWLEIVEPALKPIINKFGGQERFSLKGSLLIDPACWEKSYFRGVLTGRKIPLDDIILHHMQALITYDDGKLKVEEFSLADPAVIARCDQAVMETSKEKAGNFELKNFQVIDLRPSLLQIRNQPKGKIKPFLVRNLTVDELKGSIRQPEQITGKGQLKFINTFKRENHLIDIPLEILSRLGLDIGLLVPVRGEVDLEIKDKKVWLKELKNTFSEGKRSHFYFPNGKSCYVDFDGNIVIDVRMKQYVLFKITQPFTLSMRGTFKKPQFSLNKGRIGQR